MNFKRKKDIYVKQEPRNMQLFPPAGNARRLTRGL